MREESSLTPEEVASILKIAKNTVYELIKRGDLAAYRIGRKYRVDIRDVETYKNQGKKMERPYSNTLQLNESHPLQMKAQITPCSQGVVICGQDILLDILALHIEQHPHGTRTFRSYIGSFDGLSAVYQGKAHMTAIHLWDEDTGTYNIPYVRRLLPGIPMIIIHLACRMQGFYVAKENPKKIMDWNDLTQPGLRFINREKGSGTRVLLDERLHKLGVDRRLISGYEREEFSHLAVASTVGRGEADVALGNQKASFQVRNIDFVPLQKERYELAIKKEYLEKPLFQAVLEILQSSEFKTEIGGLGDYDLTETGRIIAET
ncbi:helix-turn-helix transcriptional regulator [Pelotomaculum terephthalicicum JT]|uniref:helix-turn-helix transcriptional regulator n=1 Tax=Pelotomaculum TaxID=191373 RepID=UPI0009C44A35|nr:MULTISPECIES: helix-turn-helix transcriptional regulator [Pelotomaculum]MCG9966604.1 helix-turn-helix transcriptional regulator [Pelotomaculum terephthalicicum JT]OPX89704.1 MAG: PBP superfamily domain protein [Pelotomaculum sp. PtaB.Bin117]OPY63543.1 MAG: PBP superfamily domain protein [Pelotomaculum sp. PtaU1.Bin065]